MAGNGTGAFSDCSNVLHLHLVGNRTGAFSDGMSFTPTLLGRRMFVTICLKPCLVGVRVRVRVRVRANACSCIVECVEDQPISLTRIGESFVVSL